MVGQDTERAEALRQARARWRAAEDRLFPVALVDAHAYRRALHVVSLLLDELRVSITSLDQLLDLDADPAPVLAALSDEPANRIQPAGSTGSDDRLTLEAAFAVRGRELAAAAERSRRAAAIASARSEGATWVDLEGSWEAVQRTGVRHTEMHLATGRALIATVDPYSGDGPHRLKLVVLDGDTGTPVETTEEDRVFGDRAQWLAERERRRAEIASSLED
ncbi:MAG: hypothetical protein M3228_14970 [Actinomycetota bacterium]|nr:hypothetical protein [Actinomycetota bacterium]MDQ4011954.1 hypothetical protein [Actinomycetota bacterium]